MLTDYGAETKTEVWAVLPRDNGRGVPETEVPKATRPAPGPANPRNMGGS